MSIASLIRSMADAGATPEAIALAVEAIEAVHGKLDEARQASRERKRRQRERDRDRDVTVTGQAVTERDTLSPSPPPRTPPPRPHTRGDIYTPARGADFDAFWQAYPAKIGKKAAEAAWAKAKDRPPLGEVLAAIDAYRRAKPPDRDWCHPSTWLNQGRWADEAPAPTPRTGTRNERPDKLAARHDNYAASWSGSERAAELMAARRTF